MIAVVEGFTGGAAPSGGSAMPPSFTWALALGFWGCLYTATVAESVAEGRGRAQSRNLREALARTPARRLADYRATRDPGAERAAAETVDAAALRPGVVVVVGPGETIPADGEVVWGAAPVDESDFTGRPGPAIREAGGDRSCVTGGTRVLADRLVVRVTVPPEASALERTIDLASRAHRQKSSVEVALSALLASFTLAFVFLAVTLNSASSPVAPAVSVPVLIAVVVCLIPTEIAALMSVTGIAGMYQLLRRSVLVTSAKSLETASEITTVLIDKTGTVTRGQRTATALLPLTGHDRAELARAAALASAGDPTPEGVSTLRLATQLLAEEGAAVPWRAAGPAGTGADPAGNDVASIANGVDPAGTGADHAGKLGALGATAIPFSAATRLSGVDLPDGTRLRKGAASAVSAWLKRQGAQPSAAVTAELRTLTRGIAASGGTPMVVAMRPVTGQARALGVIELEDVVKDSVREKIAELRRLGVRTLMVTGDHRLTAEAISREAGIDEYLGDASPEDKLALIRREQRAGHLVAMSGDGLNDAPALAQADIGIAMNTATGAAKAAANIVILDDDPAHLADIIRVGRRQMATRGALMTFNFANDLVRYATLFPALFVGAFPGLAALNVLGLHSPASAILSTVLFSTVVMGILVPLALIGVPYRTSRPGPALTRNLIYCGLGGLVVPIIGIKIIDLLVSLLPGY
ncbi:HAD-IC family P-type ATPase [Leucobacter massiliensis]|uniref:Potassium-transporting ATPase subunit B n=1 Tax=Leucobacter massiliensis TaxID=1686285 RepID=A0A2S9QR34_9MICO|nr:HAD-IC family P-type ATPase [Leucobacter massiliensis]PRI12038.1 potassium-transporting ATPase subunit B [Leucobacter massiliensis]